MARRRKNKKSRKKIVQSIEEYEIVIRNNYTRIYRDVDRDLKRMIKRLENYIKIKYT